MCVSVYRLQCPRRRGLFYSQPYLTSSQSCYINKNRVTSPARALKNRLKNYGLNVLRNRIFVIINANNADSPVWQDSDINIGDTLSLCRVDFSRRTHAFSSRSDITIICAARYWIAYAIQRLMYNNMVVTTYAKLRISFVEEKKSALK